MTSAVDHVVEVGPHGDWPARRRRRLVGARRAVWASMGALLVLTAAWSTFQWQRGGDGQDMADFNQAAWMILHGHLNPYSSVSGGGTYLGGHFGLFLYPLLPVYALHQSGLTLLVLQDLACVASSLVVLGWIIEMLERQLSADPAVLTRRYATAVAAGAIVALCVNPLLWQGVSFDFHLEAFTALFVVLAARAFWHQRPGFGLMWCAVALTTGDFAGLFVLALGLCVVVAGTGVRRWGVVAMVAGVAWMVLAGALHDNQGDNLQAYAYITGGVGGSVTTPGLALAMVAHPGRWAAMLATKPLDLYRQAVATGILGVVSPWSFAVVWAVIIPAALLGPPIFLESGFQTFVAQTVGLGGSVFVLLWLGRRVAGRWNVRAGRAVLAVVGLAVMVQVVAVAAVMVPRVPAFWIRDSAAQGQAISQAASRLPPGDEVIVSMPVMGHFSGRQWVFASITPGQVFPVETPTVWVVVAPSAGIMSMTPAQSDEAIAAARRGGAVVVSAVHGVTVLRWSVPRAVHHITLVPGTP